MERMITETMHYTIDASLRNPMVDEERPFFYLDIRKTDHGWRDASRQKRTLQDGDIILPTIEDIVHYQTNEPLEIMGRLFKTDTSMGIGMSESTAHIFPRVHRNTLPYHFSKRDVEIALLEGDDLTTTSLSVHLNGRVILAKIPENNPVVTLGHAASIEFFGAGNGYTGAAIDQNHIWHSYKALLDVWVQHLYSGEPNLHSTDFPGELQTLERKRKWWECMMKKKFNL
jgi:hypothetical protein